MKFKCNVPEEQIKALIRTVKKFPMLYNSSDPNFSDNYKRKEIWAKITRRLNFPSALEARATWKKLKAYNKALLIEMKKGKQTRRYHKYRKLMAFVDPNPQPKAEDVEIEPKQEETESNSSAQENVSLHDFFMTMYNSASLMPKMLQLRVKREIFTVLTETEEMMIAI